jgi:hypothetical protein
LISDVITAHRSASIESLKNGRRNEGLREKIMTTGTPFRGLSAFPLTPADEHGRVDTETLARLVERLCEAGVDSIGLLGSTGIYAYLAREERRRAVEAASECGRGRVPLVVGVGTLRSDHTMDLARDAEAAGADALLMAQVSYTPLTQDEAYEHYHAVTGASGLPLCIYGSGESRCRSAHRPCRRQSCRACRRRRLLVTLRRNRLPDRSQ